MSTHPIPADPYSPDAMIAQIRSRTGLAPQVEELRRIENNYRESLCEISTKNQELETQAKKFLSQDPPNMVQAKARVKLIKANKAREEKLDGYLAHIGGMLPGLVAQNDDLEFLGTLVGPIEILGMDGRKNAEFKKAYEQGKDGEAIQKKNDQVWKDYAEDQAMEDKDLDDEQEAQLKEMGF